jgi:uncharacterized protein YuzE
MSEFRPRATVAQSVLRVQLWDAIPVRSVDIECVVDQTDLGDVVGVEVLDLRKQLSGGTVLPPSHDSKIRWSYDAEMDALYLHVVDGRGQAQRRSKALAHVDSSGRLVQLDVPLARAN